MISSLTFILYFLTITTMVILNWRRPKDKLKLPFPPGPRGLPFIGSLLTFRTSPLQNMIKWNHTYGDIVGLQLGEFKILIISSFELLKEVLSLDSFNGHANLLPFNMFAGGDTKGTVTSSGQTWDVIRKFTLKNLSYLGFGRQKMEDFILNDIYKFIPKLEAQSKEGEGKTSSVAVNLRDQFYIPITTHLWYMLTGEILTAERETIIKETLLKMKAFTQPVGSTFWFCPTLTRIFPDYTRLSDLKHAMKALGALLDEQIDKHEVQLRKMKSNDDDHKEEDMTNAEPEPADLIDAFLRRSQSATDPTDEFYGEAGRNHLKGMLINLFWTGTQIIDNVISWAIQYLSIYPQVQQSLHQEIMEVIGDARIPSLKDMDRMPYTKAVVMETLRISTLAPFANFQTALEDVDFHGYLIRKGTVLLANLHGLHNDPKHWGDPEIFRPERFINDSSGTGDTDKAQSESSSCSSSTRKPDFIPFGIGLRNCPSQAYSRNVLFLLVVCLFQKFEFQAEERLSQDEIMERSNVSLFHFCNDFKVAITVRK